MLVLWKTGLSRESQRTFSVSRGTPPRLGTSVGVRNVFGVCDNDLELRVIDTLRTLSEGRGQSSSLGRTWEISTGRGVGRRSGGGWGLGQES